MDNIFLKFKSKMLNSSIWLTPFWFNLINIISKHRGIFCQADIFTCLSIKSKLLLHSPVLLTFHTIRHHKPTNLPIYHKADTVQSEKRLNITVQSVKDIIFIKQNKTGNSIFALKNDIKFLMPNKIYISQPLLPIQCSFIFQILYNNT